MKIDYHISPQTLDQYGLTIVYLLVKVQLPKFCHPKLVQTFSNVRGYP